MAVSQYLSVREAADELAIPSWRPVRLIWQLGIWSHQRCIPRDEVERIKQDVPPDMRYAALRDWLLQDYPRLARTAGTRS